MTGIANLILEPVADNAAFDAAAHRSAMMAQYDGLEKLEGTYPYGVALAHKAYRINDFLHNLIIPANRQAFRADAEASFETAGLSEEERDLLRRRDWRGLIHYGVIFFLLEKLGAVIGVSNLDIYAAMRGQTIDEFAATRNAPGARYSVAGKEAK